MNKVIEVHNHEMSSHDTQQHLLLAYAHSYVRDELDLAPPDCDYNLLIGAWVLQGSETLLVSVPGARRPPQSKKNDVETGEDQKGY